MSLRTSFRVVGVALSFAMGLAIFFPEGLARAQPKEGAAKALQKKAMEDDYLSTEFGKAQQKLESAINQCGADKCSAALRARLRRDLAVVQIGAGQDREKGIGNFVEALKIDPAIALDPDVRTKDLDQAFTGAKKRLSGSGTTPSTGAGQPLGDFTHTPILEQQVRTPIPVYVEYEGDEALNKVNIRYKGFGMIDWRTAPLKKLSDKGWGGEIPCADVHQGVTQYYIQGFNPNGDAVLGGGDRNNPYRVPVKTDRVAAPPHLPDTSPPKQCVDTGDCPPNFPGCQDGRIGAEPTSNESIGKDGGEFCKDAAECKSHKCQSSRCTDYEGEKKGPRLWIGLFGTLDYAFVPTAEDVCKLRPDAFPVNDHDYYCVNEGGVDYPYRPTSVGDSNPRKVENDNLAPTAQGNSDKVGGGGALGNVRILLSLDYAMTGNVMVGGRIGLVLNTYPGDAAGVDGKRFAVPIHIEVRTTYVLGKEALFKEGFAPYFLGAVGIGQFETRVGGVQVIEAPPGVAAFKRDVSAWQIAGPAFFTLGGGGRYALSRRFALSVGVRGNVAFLNGLAASVGPEVGGQLGF